jgi:hypothetical protein
LVVDDVIRVDQVEELPARDALSALIDEGEAILREAPNLHSEEELDRATGVFVFRATKVVAELGEPSFHKRLENAILDYSGPRIGEDYLREVIAAKVQVLYEIRDHPGI